MSFVIVRKIFQLSKCFLYLASAGGKCSQQAELSGENINITYKPDGTHVAVGNRVCYSIPFIHWKLGNADTVSGYCCGGYIFDII